MTQKSWVIDARTGQAGIQDTPNIAKVIGHVEPKGIDMEKLKLVLLDKGIISLMAEIE